MPPGGGYRRRSAGSCVRSSCSAGAGDLAGGIPDQVCRRSDRCRRAGVTVDDRQDPERDKAAASAKISQAGYRIRYAGRFAVADGIVDKKEKNPL